MLHTKAYKMEEFKLGEKIGGGGGGGTAWLLTAEWNGSAQNGDGALHERGDIYQAMSFGEPYQRNRTKSASWERQRPSNQHRERGADLFTLKYST